MIRTGIGIEEITPQEDVPLLGYGDRTHASEGVHDPLYVSCWWLEPEHEKPLAWVVLDLCLLSISTAEELANLVARSSQIDAERLFISTTHTHSGPDVRFITSDGEGWAVRYRDRLVSRMSAAITQAREGAVPARIELRQGRCTLGVNRRNSSLPVDTRLLLLSLVDTQGKELGRVFHYSCHLTVLGVDNYLISADWLGPVRDALQKEVGVPIMYLQGAEGNIDPVSRGALDMADPNQAVGASFEAMETMAAGVASSIRAAYATAPIAILTDVESKRFVVELPLRYGALSRSAVLSKVSDWKSKFAGFLGISEAMVPEDWTINALIKERCRRLRCSAEVTRHWVAEQFAYGAFLHNYVNPGTTARFEDGVMPLTATIIDFGMLVVLGVPVEALVEIAFTWQANIEGEIAVISGLFNGWAGYLPHPSNFDEPNSDQLYETVSTIFSKEAASTLLMAALHNR